MLSKISALGDDQWPPAPFWRRLNRKCADGSVTSLGNSSGKMTTHTEYRKSHISWGVLDYGLNVHARLPLALLLLFFIAGIAWAAPLSPLERLEFRRGDVIQIDDSRYGFRELTDDKTGVQLSIPFGIAGGGQPSGWGNNWATPDNRLKIATLNFQGRKTLRAVYEAIRDKKGRRITQDSFDGKGFIVGGSDSDGSIVYVQAEEQAGEVRGISITYKGTAKAELGPVVRAILRSYRGFPKADQTAANGGSVESPSLPEPQQVSCRAEMAEIMRRASGVRINIAAPAEIRAGGAIEFSWQASERFLPVTSAYIILSVPGEARFEVQPTPQPAKEASEADQDASTEPLKADLPGFIALLPTSRGPKGIQFGAGATRAVIPLHQQGSRLAGSFSVRMFEAGTFELQAAIVASGRCGERIIGGETRLAVKVVQAQPEVVVQDPYDIEVPDRAILSNSGRYLIQDFKGRYRVFDITTGAKLADRAGHQPNFSPTERFVAANTGVSASPAYEVIDLVSRQPVATATGPLIGWTESDAFLIAGGAGDWSSLVIRPTLISPPGDEQEGKFTLEITTSCKTCPSWEVLSLKLDVDAGIAVFADQGVNPKKTSNINGIAYELASGQELSPISIGKGWRAREQISFSHVYEPAADEIYAQEWVKEHAKSETLNALRAHKFSHRVLDQRAASLLSDPTKVRYVRGDWRPANSRGQVFEGGSRAGIDSFLKDLERFGVFLAAETPRESILPIVSPIEAFKNEGRANPKAAEIKKMAWAIEERIAGEVPAIKQKLAANSIMLGDTINLEKHLEGLWRWEIGHRPVWLLQAMDYQGSGVFGFIEVYLLNSQGANGPIGDLTKEMPDLLGGYAPHPAESSDNAVRLKPRVFLDRYLVVGSSGAGTIGVADLSAEQRNVVFRDVPQADLLIDALLTADGRLVIQINSDGQFYFHEIATGQTVLSGRYVDGEVILYTPEGYYWSSYEGAHFVQLRFPGLPALYSFQQFASVLDRKDIIKARLSTPAQKPPQPELTPPPELEH